jgi:hypothetical protein
MIAAHKSESPAATGLNADIYTNALNARIIPFPAKTSNCDKPNLVARLTRAGHIVYEGTDRSFVVVNARWGLSKHCPDLSALQTFACQVGVLHG